MAPTEEQSRTRCYWAILDTGMAFQYLDPLFQQHMQEVSIDLSSRLQPYFPKLCTGIHTTHHASCCKKAIAVHNSGEKAIGSDQEVQRQEQQRQREGNRGSAQDSIIGISSFLLLSMPCWPVRSSLLLPALLLHSSCHPSPCLTLFPRSSVIGSALKWLPSPAAALCFHNTCFV